MPISYSEQTVLTCPSCGKEFSSEVWMIVDAAERPDLTQALRDGTLDAVTCPYCGHSGPAGAPLLFHDGAQRRVFFAAPAGVAEHVWRRRAYELLFVLVGSLPEEARQSYLGDVQVENEVEGVRRAVLRRQRGRGMLSVERGAPPAAPPVPSESLLDVVRMLIAANDEAEFREIVRQNPLLLTDTADATLAQLIEAAAQQGQRDVAGALQEARSALGDLRDAARGEERIVPAVGSDPAAAAPASPRLADAAYQMLLLASSAEELLEAARGHPALLEPWADQELTAREELALEEENERLAAEIEERRAALAEIRTALANEVAMSQAIQALLAARDENQVAHTLEDYPILLTEAAQAALLTLATRARVQGDQAQAASALECRALLRQVREGLEG